MPKKIKNNRITDELKEASEYIKKHNKIHVQHYPCAKLTEKEVLSFWKKELGLKKIYIL